MRYAWLSIVLAASTSACLRTTSFHCSTSADCGAGGTCESVGYCSFPDSTCGQRYSSSAGPYANQCVGAVPLDGNPGDDSGMGSDAAPPDGQPNPDGGNNCPSGYVTLSGLPHVYKLITASDWASQKSACALTSPSAYLAIPDDAAELMALDTYVNGATFYWVGVSLNTANNQYETVKNQAAAYLPWAAGQPDTGPMGNPSNCVEAISADATFADEKCSTKLAAVCECEP